jgi:predicted NodU family carbamoyl transferase
MRGTICVASTLQLQTEGLLGISASHNGAVCLLKGDDNLVAFKQARLSRRKRLKLITRSQ